MAGYFINGGDIPLRYFDGTAFQLTFKVTAYGMTMTDIFEGLCQIIQSEEIVDMCKVDANALNFCVKDEQAADILSTVGRVRVRDKVFDIVNISKQIVEFRIHWLPNYIKDSLVEDFVSKCGKVTSVIREVAVFSPNDTKHTGVRRVMIETD